MTRPPDAKPRPEDLDDEAWSALLDRVEDEAVRSHLAERDRLIAAGVIDAEGRLLVPLPERTRDDSCGW
jgi:hypothetical protein